MMDRVDFLNSLKPTQRVQYIIDDFVPLSALYEAVYPYDNECTVTIVDPYNISIHVVTGNINHILNRLDNIIITAYDKKYKLLINSGYGNIIEAKLIEVSV